MLPYTQEMLDMAASNASQEMLDVASSSEAIRCDEVMDEIDWIAFHEYISTSLFLAAELLWKLGLVDFDCVMHYLQRLPVCVQRRLLLRRRCTLNWRTDDASLELAQQLLANFNKLGPESLSNSPLRSDPATPSEVTPPPHRSDPATPPR